MKKEFFEEAQLEVLLFEINDDIVTTSPGDGDVGGNSSVTTDDNDEIDLGF